MINRLLKLDFEKARTGESSEKCVNEMGLWYFEKARKENYRPVISLRAYCTIYDALGVVFEADFSAVVVSLPEVLLFFKTDENVNCSFLIGLSM